jgi:hypothetical protein
MGFHWYIDVTEPGRASFSAGPIILANDENMSVSAFVEMVNTAFLNVYENDIHDTLYTMSARLVTLEGQATPGVTTETNLLDWPTATQAAAYDGGLPRDQHLHTETPPYPDPKSPMVHGDHDIHTPDTTWAESGELDALPITEEHFHPAGHKFGDPTSWQVSPTAASAEYAQALASQQFIVEYRIANHAGHPGRPFIINFNTGPHGQDIVLPATHTATAANPPSARITVTNTANIQPMVMDHCKITAMITDMPPVPPDMWFIPYRGVNDRMLILFSPNIGRRRAKPILLATSDSTFIIEEYYSQKDLIVDPANLGAIEETLEYASDDPTRTYEIFRMDTMPTSYSSFIDHHLATVEEQLAPQKFSTGVSYLDTLLPNVKYYYCGRSIDRHRNISNPTPITELELVDNNGQLYVNKKIFTFPTIPQRPTKSGRRLLAIEPSQLQQAYSLENPGVGPGQAVVGTAPPSNLIGTAADSVWDKKFKIRITSQKTGKKMDLNITFKNTGVANP